jgi:hypothetical protein
VSEVVQINSDTVQERAVASEKFSSQDDLLKYITSQSKLKRIRTKNKHRRKSKNNAK